MSKVFEVLTWHALFSVMPYMQVENGKEPWLVFGGQESDWQIMFENVMVRGISKSSSISTAIKGSDNSIVVSHNHNSTVSEENNHTHSITTSDSVFNGASFFEELVKAGSNTTIANTSGSFNSNIGMGGTTTRGKTVTIKGQTITSGVGSAHTHTIIINPAGSSGTGKNIPAYKEVKFWKYIGGGASKEAI